MELIINPEYDRLVFRQDEKTYSDLKTSIDKNGQYHPIIINEKYVVLDGHHRVRICRELNIEPWTQVKKFESDLHERLFVVDSNLTRRHLNDYQRIKLALWAKPILQEIAKKNMSLGGQGLEISTTLNVRQEIAARAKVSDNQISKGELVIKYNTSKEIEQKLETGKTTINAVFNELKKTQAKQRILSQKVKHVANVQLFHGDFIEQADKHR